MGNPSALFFPCAHQGSVDSCLQRWHVAAVEVRQMFCETEHQPSFFSPCASHLTWPELARDKDEVALQFKDFPEAHGILCCCFKSKAVRVLF